MKFDYDIVAFGKRVRYYRKKMKLTQEQLSEKSYVSTRTIGIIERGERFVGLHILEELSDVLRVELAFELLDYQIITYDDEEKN